MTMKLTTSLSKIYFTVFWCVCVCVCVSKQPDVLVWVKEPDQPRALRVKVPGGRRAVSLKRRLAQWRRSRYQLYARTYKGSDSSTTTFSMASRRARISGGACFLEVVSPNDSASSRRFVSNSLAAPVRPEEVDRRRGLGTPPASSKKDYAATRVLYTDRAACSPRRTPKKRRTSDTSSASNFEISSGEGLIYLAAKIEEEFLENERI